MRGSEHACSIPGSCSVSLSLSLPPPVLEACVLAANVVKDLLAHREVLVQGFNELDLRFEQKV